MSLSKCLVTIATANTHWSRALGAPDGLAPLAAADILLLQEVVESKIEGIAQLERAGFRLISLAKCFGLAMAVKACAPIRFIPDSLIETRLQTTTALGRRVTKNGQRRPYYLAERGMQAAKFIAGNTTITVVNVHLSVPARHFARAAQVRALGRELSKSYYAGSLIVAGDMNHYRGPQLVDVAMHTAVQLRPVDLRNEPTWRAHGSHQERYLRVMTLFTGRSISYYDGRHDAMLYRGPGLKLEATKVMDIQSDHRAIVSRFSVG